MQSNPTILGPTRSRRSPRGGFTLMEVLVAIALLAIVIPVAMSATAQALRAADSAKHRSQAAALAETQLAQLAVDPNVASAAMSGDFGPDYAGYQWIGEIDNWSEGTTQMQQLRITVMWGSSNQIDGQVTVSTLIYPTSTDSTGGTQ